MILLDAYRFFRERNGRAVAALKAALVCCGHTGVGLALLLSMSGCAPAPLRAHPTMAFTPAEVLLQLHVPETLDAEKAYCPRIEWRFGDGCVEVIESDCAPFVAGMAVGRLYSIRHCYRLSGDYDVLVSLWHAARQVFEARAWVRILWAPGGGSC